MADTENKTDSLREIEERLTICLADDRHTWVQIYKLMTIVDTEQLYKQDGLHSFTAWVNRLATRTSTHVSVLWQRLNAGRTYDAYEARANEAGRNVPTLDDIGNMPRPISPDSVALCSRVGGKDTAVTDRLIDQLLSGSLSREDLREAARAKRRESEKAIFEEPKKSETDDGDIIANAGQAQEQPKMTAANIIAAIRRPDWLSGLSFVQRGRGAREIGDAMRRQGRYGSQAVCHVLSEVRAASGTTRNTRRMDAVMAETLSCVTPGDIRLHGFEIKVSPGDLRRDHKMAEYAPFVDLLWFAVPDIPEMIKAAEEVRLPEWGVLAISAAPSSPPSSLSPLPLMLKTCDDRSDSFSGSVRIVHEASGGIGQMGVMREQTLAALVIRARDFRQELPDPDTQDSTKREG